MKNFTEEELKRLLHNSYEFVQEHPEIILTKSEKEGWVHIDIDYLYVFECPLDNLFGFIYGYKLALVYRGEAKI